MDHKPGHTDSETCGEMKMKNRQTSCSFSNTDVVRVLAFLSLVNLPPLSHLSANHRRPLPSVNQSHWTQLTHRQRGGNSITRVILRREERQLHRIEKIYTKTHTCKKLVCFLLSGPCSDFWMSTQTLLNAAVLKEQSRKIYCKTKHCGFSNS